MLQLPDTTTKAGQIEASRMLFDLMGWKTIEILGRMWITVPGLMFDEKIQWADEVHPNLNLYAVSATGGEPLHMPLAWRVLNWAATQTVTVKAQKGGGDDIWQEPWTTFIDDEINGKYELYRMPPADAQRAWLDKILSLAIEAGMVDAAAKE